MSIYGHPHILYRPPTAKRAPSLPKHTMPNHPPATSAQAQHLFRISKLLRTIQGAIIRIYRFQMKCSRATLLLCCLASRHSSVSLNIITTVRMKIVTEHTSLLHFLLTRVQPLSTHPLLILSGILHSKRTVA